MINNIMGPDETWCAFFQQEFDLLGLDMKDTTGTTPADQVVDIDDFLKEFGLSS